jgi:hypothetical protein
MQVFLKIGWINHLRDDNEVLERWFSGYGWRAIVRNCAVCGNCN